MLFGGGVLVLAMAAAALDFEAVIGPLPLGAAGGSAGGAMLASASAGGPDDAAGGDPGGGGSGE